MLLYLAVLALAATSAFASLSMHHWLDALAGVTLVLATLTYWQLAPRLLPAATLLVLAVMAAVPFLRRISAFGLRGPLDTTWYLLFPALSVGAFLGTVLAGRIRVDRSSRQVGLFVGILVVVGGITGGLHRDLVGDMVYVTPIAWYFVGRNWNATALVRVLDGVIVIGCIEAVYGLTQAFLPLLPWDHYWLNSVISHYAALYITGHRLRAWGTFANNEEYSRWLEFALLALIWRGVRSKGQLYGKVLAMALAVFLLAALVVAGTKSSVGGAVIAGTVMLFWRSGVQRALISGTLALGLGLAVEKVLGHSRTGHIFAGTTTRALSNPFAAPTVQARFHEWGALLRQGVVRLLAGHGMGAIAPGGGFGFDSYFFALLYGAGLLAMVGFVWIGVRALLCAARAANWSESELFVGLILIVLVNSLFGATPGLYAVGPLTWLVLGVAMSLRQTPRARNPVGDQPGEAPGRDARPIACTQSAQLGYGAGNP